MTLDLSEREFFVAIRQSVERSSLYQLYQQAHTPWLARPIFDRWQPNDRFQRHSTRPRWISCEA